MSDPSIGNDLTVQALQYAVDGLTLQQTVTSNNIANDTTPGYQASAVDFETSLQNAIQTQPGNAEASVSVHPTGDPSATNGNNVNLADQLVNSTRDGLQYEATVNALNFKFRLIKGALGGGYT